MATNWPFSRLRHLNTMPYDPSPIFAIFSYFSIELCIVNGRRFAVLFAVFVVAPEDEFNGKVPVVPVVAAEPNECLTGDVVPVAAMLEVGVVGIFVVDVMLANGFGLLLLSQSFGGPLTLPILPKLRFVASTIGWLRATKLALV